MPLEDGETRPDYLRPPCAPSFIKSGLIPILHQYFTHSLYVYAGETIMPPAGAITMMIMIIIITNLLQCIHVMALHL